MKNIVWLKMNRFAQFTAVERGSHQVQRFINQIIHSEGMKHQTKSKKKHATFKK
jgi:hypothetical protein